MKMFIKPIYTALLGVAVLSSCSRPVAYFQRGPIEHYNTKKTEVAPSVSVNEITQPAEIQPGVSESPVVSPTPSQQVTQAQAAMAQIDAYVRNDSKLAMDKKLTKRMDRARYMLSNASVKKLAVPNTTSAKKMTLLERISIKHIDKKIRNKLAPERTMATSMLTIGLIVAAAGLLLLLIGNGFGAVIGGIALIVGLVLVLLELLKQ